MTIQTISTENLPVIAHNSTPVITTELLAQLYGTDVDNIRQNFNRNTERFIEGKHFFKLTGEQLKEFRLSVTNCHAQISNKTRYLTLWTERGAARHAKMLDTDQAWEVFEKLEDCYFGKQQNTQPTFDLTETLSQTLNQISKGNKKLYMSMYNGLTRRFAVGRLADIPHAEIHNALATIYFFAVEWHRKNTPTQLPLKLNDGEHYLVVKDGVVLWERKLKPNCNDIPANTLQNPKLMLEHIREVVGEFVGKEALPAPKPILDINYPAITARPRNSFLPNQHWFQAKDFVSGNFDPVRDFLDKLEQDGYEVTGLKIINNAKTFIIQQQDKAIKHIEKGYKVLVEGVNLCNEKGLYVSGFTMGKVSY